MTKGKQITQSDFLTAKGGYLKNQKDEIVVLKGVNAGGWLIQESWMCPINGADRAWANLDTINTLKGRGFTEEQIQKLFDTYQDNWFTTIDLDNLQAMGANCLRVPFWYRNFMSDEKGTWITGDDLDANPGIKRLDWVVEECGKRGIYVILDCHGAPGGQSMDHCCGTLCKNEIYDVPENRVILRDLWTKIAERYKGNPVVAAYDILNEPQNNKGYEGANSWMPGTPEALSRTYDIYDDMYKVIRAVDADHVLSVESIWDGKCLPAPSEYGWTNMLYQMHIYDTTKPMVETRVGELRYFQEQYGVAAYAGEFNCGPQEEYAMDLFNEAGISWTTWAYKGAKQRLGNGWFLYVKEIPYVDVTVDEYDVMLEKWGRALRTDRFDVNADTVKAWIEAHV